MAFIVFLFAKRTAGKSSDLLLYLVLLSVSKYNEKIFWVFLPVPSGPVNPKSSPYNTNRNVFNILQSNMYGDASSGRSFNMLLSISSDKRCVFINSSIGE